jgi:hypothetical protein
MIMYEEQPIPDWAKEFMRRSDPSEALYDDSEANLFQSLKKKKAKPDKKFNAYQYNPNKVSGNFQGSLFYDMETKPFNYDDHLLAYSKRNKAGTDKRLAELRHSVGLEEEHRKGIMSLNKDLVPIEGTLRVTTSSRKKRPNTSSKGKSDKPFSKESLIKAAKRFQNSAETLLADRVAKASWKYLAGLSVAGAGIGVGLYSANRYIVSDNNKKDK